MKANLQDAVSLKRSFYLNTGQTLSIATEVEEMLDEGDVVREDLPIASRLLIDLLCLVPAHPYLSREHLELRWVSIGWDY